MIHEMNLFYIKLKVVDVSAHLTSAGIKTKTTILSGTFYNFKIGFQQRILLLLTSATQTETNF